MDLVLEPVQYSFVDGEVVRFRELVDGLLGQLTEQLVEDLQQSLDVAFEIRTGGDYTGDLREPLGSKES